MGREETLSWSNIPVECIELAKSERSPGKWLVHCVSRRLSLDCVGLRPCGSYPLPSIWLMIRRSWVQRFCTGKSERQSTPWTLYLDLGRFIKKDEWTREIRLTSSHYLLGSKNRMHADRNRNCSLFNVKSTNSRGEKIWLTDALRCLC